MKVWLFLRYAMFFWVCHNLMACADVAMTGAQVVYNRHSLQQNFQDHYMTRQAYQALYMKSDQFRNTNIVIATYNGEVLLTGQVPYPWQRQKAEAIVRDAVKTDMLYNLIAIEGTTSTITRLNDAWITSKVKAKLIASNEVDASRIKVVTENSRVYLMGLVTKPEAQAAALLASTTDGVTNVVKAFTYLYMSKT